MGAAASVENSTINNNDKEMQQSCKEMQQSQSVRDGLIGLSRESEQKTIDTLSALRDLDEDKFERIMASVKFKSQHTKPLFCSCDVNEVARIDAKKREEFSKKYISTKYIHDYSSPEAKERLEEVEETQFKRWKWAVKNVKTLVNMFREAGHTDKKIQNMFEGVPFCFPDAEFFHNFCESLKELCKQIEETLPLKHAGIVITGSSVVGFSQNPLKGEKDTPSKITSSEKSDVDICVYAHGVEKWFEFLRESNKDFKFKKYPTTVSLTECGYRYGIKPRDMRLASKVISDFHEAWHEKKLKGGLQITFCEIRRSIPPWEIRLPL